MVSEDIIRLRHMLDAAWEAISFSAGISAEALAEDSMLLLCLTKDLEIIGEAAHKVSVATQQRLDSIPWDVIVGMRNRLIHGYFDVDVKVVWRAVAEDLPQRAAQLEAALAAA